MYVIFPRSILDHFMFTPHFLSRNMSKALFIHYFDLFYVNAVLINTDCETDFNLCMRVALTVKWKCEQ